MSLYDRVVAPTLAESATLTDSTATVQNVDVDVSEAVAKWARRSRSKSASDSTQQKARWRANYGSAAGDHRKMFGKKPGGHAAAGAWQGSNEKHADWKSRMAAHKASRGVKTRGQ